MKKLVLFTTLFVLLALTVTNVEAQNRQAKKDRNFDRGDRIAEFLKLTDEQKSMIDDLQYENQSQAIDKRSEMEKNKLEIKKMMDDSDINESKLMSLVNKNSQIQADLKSSKVKMWLDIYNVLDDTQKEIWTDHFPMGNNHGFNRTGGRGMRPGQGLEKEHGMRNGVGMGMGDRPCRFQN